MKIAIPIVKFQKFSRFARGKIHVVFIRTFFVCNVTESRNFFLALKKSPEPISLYTLEGFLLERIENLQWGSQILQVWFGLPADFPSSLSELQEFVP